MDDNEFHTSIIYDASGNTGGDDGLSYISHFGDDSCNMDDSQDDDIFDIFFFWS